MRVAIPDFKRTVDSLTDLLTQAEGRPEQRQPEAAVVIVERPPL